MHVKNIYIWGAGYYGAMAALDMERNGKVITGFIDNNKELQGKKRLGYEVFSPKQIIKDNKAFITIAIAANAAGEIADELEANGYKEGEDFDFFGTLTIRERKIYDLLADDLSRDVFMARKKFADFGHDDFFRVMKTPKCFEFLRGKKYAVYQYGWRTSHLGWFIKNYGNCTVIWDRNAVLGKKCYDVYLSGIPVLPPPNGTNESSNFDYVLNCVDNPSTAKSINIYLYSLGFTESQIIWYNNYDEQYLDEDIIVPLLSENEIFADIGCLDFYTSLAFLQKCPNPKRILAFEPDDKNMIMVKQGWETNKFERVDFFSVALYSCDTELHFNATHTSGSAITNDDNATIVQARKLDSIAEKVTFIKMDIEGAELEALKGAERIIIEQKPKLAICIYHSMREYITIPEYIHQLVPEYKLYMRHHTTQHQETVLYCII